MAIWSNIIKPNTGSNCWCLCGNSWTGWIARLIFRENYKEYKAYTIQSYSQSNVSRVAFPVTVFKPSANLQRYSRWSSLKGTSVKSAPCITEPLKDVFPVVSAPSKLALLKLTLVTLAKEKSAPLRSASDRSAPVKSASKKLAPSNFAPLKLACLSIEVLKSCLIKLLPLKSFPVRSWPLVTPAP